MDPAQIRFIWFIKERGAENFRTIRPSPYLWELFKDSRPSHTAGGNYRILTANNARSSTCGLLFTTYSYWRQRYEQFWKQYPTAQWTSLDCHLSFLNRKSRYDCSAPLEVSQRVSHRHWGRWGACKQLNAGFSLSITKQGPKRPFQWRNEFLSRIGILIANSCTRCRWIL
jgi:hypothetical protein